MKHTPGPWIAHPCPPDVNKGNFWIAGPLTLDGYSDIAEINTVTTRGHDETKANAFLMAAAPELLEACKAALNFLDYIPPSDKKWSKVEVLDMLDAAIAKAEGRVK